jgi:ribulose-phosphate 3-epimerase
MTEVIPAIIPEDFQLLSSEMVAVKEYVPLVQIDIIDGLFAPDPTWPYTDGPGAAIFKEITAGKRGFPLWKKLQFEIDLMVKRPEEVLEDWIATGASAIIIHADSTDKHTEIFDRLAEGGVGIGLALKPSNSNDLVEQFIDEIDFLQLMGSDQIGYHGVELDPLVYDKIADIRAGFPNLPIAVDIGVNLDTAPQLVRAGATQLVSGSAIFGSGDIPAAIERLSSAGS